VQLLSFSRCGTLKRACWSTRANTRTKICLAVCSSNVSKLHWTALGASHLALCRMIWSMDRANSCGLMVGPGYLESRFLTCNLQTLSELLVSEGHGPENFLLIQWFPLYSRLLCLEPHFPWRFAHCDPSNLKWNFNIKQVGPTTVSGAKANVMVWCWAREAGTFGLVLSLNVWCFMEGWGGPLNLCVSTSCISPSIVYYHWSVQWLLTVGIPDPSKSTVFGYRKYRINMDQHQLHNDAISPSTTRGRGTYITAKAERKALSTRDESIPCLVWWALWDLHQPFFFGFRLFNTTQMVGKLGVQC